MDSGRAERMLRLLRQAESKKGKLVGKNKYTNDRPRGAVRIS